MSPPAWGSRVLPNFLCSWGWGHGRGSTYPPPEPPCLLMCVRGSLEASFSSSVHSRSHSSSVYTSPDWRKGGRAQEGAATPYPPPR